VLLCLISLISFIYFFENVIKVEQDIIGNEIVSSFVRS
jgi:hypothetical protein